MNIILACEEINKILQPIKGIDYASVAKTIFGQLSYNIDSFYDSSHFEEHHENKVVTHITHKEEFILEVVHTFLTMKAKQICKRISFEEQAEDRKRRLKKRSKIIAGK